MSSRGPYLSSKKSLQILQLLHLWKGPSNIYPCFLSIPLQFFLFTRLLISSLWRGQWWGIFLLCCCCLFSAIVYSLSLSISDQVGAGTAPVRGEGHCSVHAVWGRGAASRVCTRVIDTSQTLPLALIGCIEPERWILENQIAHYSFKDNLLVLIVSGKQTQ